MTLLLFTLIGLGIFSASYNSRKKTQIATERKRTMTSIELQRKFFSENMLRVVNKLIEMNEETQITEDNILDALICLYEYYDLPYELTEKQEDKIRDDYLKKINKFLPTEEAKEKFRNSSMIEKLWFENLWVIPILDEPERMFGEPGSKVALSNGQEFFNQVGDKAYYDEAGLFGGIFYEGSTYHFYNIIKLLARRDLAKTGCHWAYDWKGSSWQVLQKQTAQYEEKQKKYPWYYN